MQILVDADSLPGAIKTIIIRAAERKQINLVFVANRYLKLPDKPYITMVTVAKNPDEADNYIVKVVKEGDLVITADIPFADRVISKKAHALDPRGKLFTETNIKTCLATRDLMEQLRKDGLVEGGQGTFNTKDVQLFANQLDRFLTKFAK